MKITVARIYINEGKHIHEKVFKRLHDDHKVKGVTIIRGISGFGQSGHEHSSHLLDMSFDLPVVVEFFDREDNVLTALASLTDLVPPGHTILFEAELPDV